MAVMGERLPEAWIVEWHRHRRVEFPLRRWTFLQFPLFLSLAPLGRLPDMLADDTGRFLGYSLIVVYVGMVVVIVWQLVTQRPYLVVDRSGIRQGRRFMPWADIGSTGLITGSGPFRRLSIHPKNIWAKDLVVSRQHVNDLQSFRIWLDEVLEEQRRSETVEKSDDASDR